MPPHSESPHAPETDAKAFTETALQQASEIARHYFGNVSRIQVKKDDNNQVLTDADLAIGSMIVAQIQKQFPTHNIIDEEAGIIDKKSDYTWVVDPTDGSSNFAIGQPSYGIILGLLHKGIPTVGGIALPFFNEVVSAEKGKGAFLNGKRITVSSEPLSSSLMAYGIDSNRDKPEITKRQSEVYPHLVNASRNVRSSGSGAYDTVMIARGAYGGALIWPNKIWDIVGPQVIIAEAGGVCTDAYGQPNDFTSPLQKIHDNFTCAMGSPLVHQEIQRIVHNVYH